MSSQCAQLTACRTYALHKHRPITLHPTIHPPSLDEVPSDRPIAVGLELMINMFKIIDDTFINLWNRVHNTNASAAWFTQVQTQLSEAPAKPTCAATYTIHSPVMESYPIEIARDLLTISHQFSQQAMEMHGVGLVSSFSFFCSSAPKLEIVSFRAPPSLAGTIPVVFRSH